VLCSFGLVCVTDTHAHDKYMPFESTYNKELAMEICVTISSSSKSLATIAGELGLEVRTVWRWIAAVDEFRDMYEKAKEQQADYLVEEMVEIADEPSKDLVDAQDRKLRVGVRQWAASKLKAKKYGVNSNVDVNVNMRRVVSGDQMEMLRAGLVKEIAAPSSIEDAEEVDE